MSEDPESAPESTSSIEHPSSEEEVAEDEDTESEGDMNSGESGELPSYDGSTLTSANFDALLLALFKKHRMSEASKEDMLKLLELCQVTTVLHHHPTNLTKDMMSAYFLIS